MRALSASLGAAVLLVATAAVVGGCKCGARSGVEGDAAALLAPLEAKSWREEIPLERFGPASVSVPLGTTRPRSIVIVLHGDADRPEWQCGTWRHIAGPDQFVLAPRGLPRDKGPLRAARFTFGGFDQTQQELRAALGALKYRYGSYVASGSVVLVGFTLGAAHALELARREPAFFSRVVLVSPEPKPWTSALAAIFAQRGGQRVLFACLNPACHDAARRSSLFIERAGAEAKVVGAAGARGLDKRLIAELKKEWPWVTSGDARFAQ
jgi:pimeloyl-ACP methyl ester carboxylesterase